MLMYSNKQANTKASQLVTPQQYAGMKFSFITWNIQGSVCSVFGSSSPYHHVFAWAMLMLRAILLLVYLVTLLLSPNRLGLNSRERAGYGFLR